jgi:hypothetical protein
MALTQRGKHRYADTQADLREELARYAAANGYPTAHYADARCTCGATSFRLALDDEAGAAVRKCGACSVEHPIADSAEYLDDANLEECACPCEAESFEITIGVALYAESSDVRWMYVACRCVACGLAAVYGDWKSESGDYDAFLRRV